MLQTRHLLTLAVLALATERVHTHDRDPAPCGGHLRDPVGIIQTPNFPGPFPVPLRCRWIIENSKTNGTISIYFTQQYTTSGLSFTEYLYYDETYKAGERRALTVTDDNITRVKYLQVTSPFLAVELTVPRLEGSQLRALGLLDVFGVNITYEVREGGATLQDGACSAIECRLLGHCYANSDFTGFYCACFEGYSGPDCGTGPLCPKDSNTCKNGGTCRQLGVAAWGCICPPGYTGDLCETVIVSPECGIEECMDGCRDSKNCDCNPRDGDTNSARFDTRLQILSPALDNFSPELLHQITTYLRTCNITLEDDIEVLDISEPEVTPLSSGKPARTVALRVWGLRREAGSLRTALARLVASRAALDNFSLLPLALQLDMQPALTLAKLSSTPRQEVWQGSEFILSCMAYGSPDIAFTWYKDGVRIQFNRTERDIWTRTVVEDALGRRLAVLGVGRAARADSGAWACVARDAGRTRCRTLSLTVLTQPHIRLLPPTVTVNKGENASITCLVRASGRVHGVLGFSWAREGSLLPLVPGREVWEDLYPAGSVLKLYNVQKSAEYSCQVSSAAGAGGESARVWVAGAGGACAPGAALGLRWRATAAGASDVADCPAGYSGRATRYCETKTSSHGVEWALPDFSDCLADSLGEIYDEFVRISYGYSPLATSGVARRYSAVLRPLPALPGGGARPLQHAVRMLSYLRSPACGAREKSDAVAPVADIFNVLLAHRDSFLDEQKIFELQNALTSIAYLNDRTNLTLSQYSLQSLPVREDSDLLFYFPAGRPNQPWRPLSAGVELVERTRTMNLSLVAAHYYNLADNLPSLRRTTEFRAEGELEYRLVSHHVQLGSVGLIADSSGAPLLPAVRLLYANTLNYTHSGARFACGVRTQSEPGAWEMRTCDTRSLDSGQIECVCRGLGTYGLLHMDRAVPDAESSTRGVVSAALIGACVLGAAAGVSQLPLLFPRARLPALLRAAFCFSQSLALGALLHCDTQTACAGGAGWCVAVCWCVCSATLAAQPLLLQAELAGRTHTNTHSVAVLAGVCIMSWLAALLSGGAPLQLGAGSMLATCGACALLGLLGAALAVSALARLRAVCRKIPRDRRDFVDSRAGVVRRIVALLVCSASAHAAAILYVQPGHKPIALPAALAASALATGICMIVCYVVRPVECAQWRNLATLSLKPGEWEHGSDTGNTSLSLFIKHGQEAESRSAGAAVTAASYWRAPTPDSPSSSQQITR